MKNVTKEELSKKAKETKSSLVKELALKKIEEEFKGDIFAQKLIQLSQVIAQAKQQPDLNEDEVKRIVRQQVETEKISFDNLDEALKGLLTNKPTKITISVKSKGKVTTQTSAVSPQIEEPFTQKILSDVLARNNVYLYGGAGTGKSYLAGVLAKFLNWELIEVNCNQFTSSLELIGGQTIDGYQEGKLIRAYGNLLPNGQLMKDVGKNGCVLLLDELPKIDPNTAGLLNSVLAKAGQFNSDGTPATIQNARGEKIKRGNIFILANGNTLLNTQDAEYEANFKQDLSLQDRFTGSTYEVFVSPKTEWFEVLKQNWAFIFIYLTKLRQIIFEEGFQSKAFVSLRLMQSVQKTYNVFRSIKGSPNSLVPDLEVSETPAPVEVAYSKISSKNVKTVKNTMDEFFNLFTDDQVKTLKEKSDYDGWLQIVKTKNKLPLNKLNTQQELDEVKQIINKAEKSDKDE